MQCIVVDFKRNVVSPFLVKGSKIVIITNPNRGWQMVGGLKTLSTPSIRILAC